MKQNYRYEKGPDGRFREVQESEADGLTESDLLKKYAGLLGQEGNILQDLAQCRARIEGLRPAVEAIMQRMDEEAGKEDGSSKTEGPCRDCAKRGYQTKRQEELRKA